MVFSLCSVGGFWLGATPWETLTHLSCSPNFPRASYLDERTLTYESIVNWKLFADVLFNHKTTFFNKGKVNSHFVPILPCLLWRVVQYTQELDANKLLHSNYWNCNNKSLLLLMRLSLTESSSVRLSRKRFKNDLSPNIELNACTFAWGQNKLCRKNILPSKIHVF